MDFTFQDHHRLPFCKTLDRGYHPGLEYRVARATEASLKDEAEIRLFARIEVDSLMISCFL